MGSGIYLQRGVISPSVGAGAQYNWPLYLVLWGSNPSVGDRAQYNWSIYLFAQGTSGRVGLKSAQGSKAESVWFLAQLELTELTQLAVGAKLSTTGLFWHACGYGPASSPSV